MTVRDLRHAGISRLADGSVLVTGGGDNMHTSKFDINTGAWSSLQLMNIGRGYQVRLCTSPC